MAKETRFGLLLGLIIIVGFGLLLSELSGKGGEQPASPADPQKDLFNKAPVIEDNSPHIGRVAQADAQQYAARNHGSAGRPGETYAIVSSPERRLVSTDAAMVDNDVYNENASAGGNQTPLDVVIPVADHRNDPVAEPEPEVASPPSPANRVYRVKSGDTLTKIARTVYGAGKESMYKDILQANRESLGNGDKLTIGQELVIPTSSTLAPARSGTEGGVAALQNRLDREVNFAPQSSESPQSPANRRMYVVQRGDNLSKIAKNMLHSSSKDTIQKIVDANKDKIKNPNNIPAGTELVIPG